MSHPEGMQTLAARLASFESSKPKGRKRTSTKGKKTDSNWSLESPTPEELAQAGFFFTATTSSPDNVTCFHCSKSLDEWEEGDNPFQEHLQFAPECAWAVTMAVERGVIVKDDDHDPLADEFVEIRAATFGNSWPHENKKGWTPKVKKLVDAGWHFNPHPEGEDQTKCAYCSLVLDGWEPKDKPIDEHKRRSPDCAFFRLTQLHKKTRKSKKSRASKASRASTISIATWTKEVSQLPDDEYGADDEVNIDDSMMTTATDVTTASIATNTSAAPKKSTRAKKPVAKTTRGKKKTAAMEDEELDIEEANVEEDAWVEEKPNTGRKRSSAVMLGGQPDVPTSPPKKRATRGRSMTTRPEPVTAVAEKDVLGTEERSEPADQEMPENTHKAKIETNVTSEEPSQGVSVLAEEHEMLSMPKRGTKTKAARGSAASRTASGSKARKATGIRKASNRKASVASTTAGVIVQAPAHETMDVDDDAEIEAKLAADLDRPLSDEESSENTKLQPKPKRQAKGKHTAKTATSRNAASPASSAQIVASNMDSVEDDMEEDELAQAPEVRSSSAIPKEPSSDANKQLDDDVGQSAPTKGDGNPDGSKAKKGAKKTGTAPKAKRGRPPKRAAQENEPEQAAQPRLSETEMHRFSSSFEEMPSVVEDSQITEQPEKAPVAKRQAPTKKGKAAKTAKAPAMTKKGKGKKASTVLTTSDESFQVKEETRVEDPMPLPSPPHRGATPQEEAPTPAASAPGAFPSPTPSPQSSNAENEPPSSRPSQSRPPLAALTPNRSLKRSPSGSAEPTTPTRSVDRVRDDGTVSPQWALKSGFPWRAVDIENVFLPSPESKRTKWFAANTAEAEEAQEPLRASKDVKDSKKNLSAAAREKEERIRQMRAVLSSAEKKMTVEEWIRWNAGRGEDKLRAECERVVGKFESEGIRAMKALEGLLVEEWA